MTTLLQLDKFGAEWFNDQMRRRGFAVERKFVFWRKRGPLFDMFMPHIMSGGGHLKVYISIWSPWGDHPDTGELGDFPPAYTSVGGVLSEMFPDRLRDEFTFDISTEEETLASFRQILALIDQRALPWFRSVDSYASYVAYIDARSFEGTSEWRNQLKKGMAKGFELEPF